MTMHQKSRFLSDVEKLKYFASLSSIDLGVYWKEIIFKVYEGAEILLYHYDKGGRLAMDTVLMCTGVAVNELGLRVTFVDRKNFKVFTVGNVPNLISGFDIVSHVPPRCEIEKTVKETRDGKKLLGTAAGVIFRMSSAPESRSKNTTYAIPLLKARNYFHPVEYARAIKRLEE